MQYCMNANIMNTWSDLPVRELQNDERDSLRQRHQVRDSRREGSMRKQWKRGRAVCFGVTLIIPLVAALHLLVSFEYVAGFQVSKIGGGPKRNRHPSIIASSSASTNLRRDGVPLKSVGDEISSTDMSSEDGNRIDTIELNNSTDTDSDTTNPLLMNFNASGSIGSLLLQMQRKEAELRLLNKSTSLLFSEDQALKLDAIKTKSDANDDVAEAEETAQKGNLFSWIRKQDGDISGIGSASGNTADERTLDDEIAKELDSSVSIRIANSVKDVVILGPPEIDRIKPRAGISETAPSNTEGIDHANAEKKVSSPKEEGREWKKKMRSTSDTFMTEDNLPSLSKAEHYNGRIGRDMRHLAVSIASCINSVEEWQIFCQQSTDGLEPLIECIREGAESIRDGSNSALRRREEDFRVASSACRVLRDLCALSLDLAAVITDGLLRANADYKSKGGYTLMDDMCTLLRQSDDFLDNNASKKSAQGSKRRLFRWRKKREAKPKTTQSGLEDIQPSSQSKPSSKWPMGNFRSRREARLQCKLYVTQLLLEMTCASDSAVDAIRLTEGLKDALHMHSSYARKERRRRWLRYPGEKLRSIWLAKSKIRQKFSSKSSTSQKPEKKRRQPFIEAASLQNNLKGKIQGTSNQVLAAIGYNEWVPKIPGQKGLR